MSLTAVQEALLGLTDDAKIKEWLYSDAVAALLFRATLDSARPEAQRSVWKSINLLPAKDDVYLARDEDGQMTFASWSQQYGWEHAVDNDCGVLVEWALLPENTSRGPQPRQVLNPACAWPFPDPKNTSHDEVKR